MGRGLKRKRQIVRYEEREGHKMSKTEKRN